MLVGDSPNKSDAPVRSKPRARRLAVPDKEASVAPTKSRTASAKRQISALGAAALARALRFALEEIATDCAFDLWASARPRLNLTLSPTTALIFRDLPPHELSEAIMRLH